MGLRFRSAVTGRAAFAAALSVLLAISAARAEYAENFDAVVPPVLPDSWTTANFGFTWTTTTNTPDSPPNCATATTLDQVSEAYLDSPVIDNGATTHLVRFRHRFQLESSDNPGKGLPAVPVGYDGGVLEIAIGPADYQDIIAAGGEFLAGGYTLPISDQSGSLIGGRQAWSGDSGGYISTSVRLPPSAINSIFRLRFRLSSDSNTGGGVWAIDSLDVVDECISQDTEPPTVACSESIMLATRYDICRDNQITLGGPTDLATITDNCVGELVLTQDPPAGTRIGPGTSQVIITATDPAGNTSQCTTVLTVVDPVAGQCGICCGAGLVEALLVTFGSLGVRKLSRRRSRPWSKTEATSRIK